VPTRTQRAHLKLLAAPKSKLAKALRGGVVVPVSSIGPGTVQVKARTGKTVVAAGRAQAAHAGRVLVHLRFTKAARRRYRYRRHLALTLTVVQGPQHVTGRLRLTR
jgi:hypothetical protein